MLEQGVSAATVTDDGAGVAASTRLASAAAAAAAAAGADCFATSAHRNSNTPMQLPVAAVPADAYRCHSKFLAAPVAADVAADPVHAAPPSAMSPCLLHPLMLRIDVTIRGGELLARSRRPLCYCYRWSCWCCRLHAACLGCCCCCCCCWSLLFCNPRSPKIQYSFAAACSCCAC